MHWGAWRRGVVLKPRFFEHVHGSRQSIAGCPGDRFLLTAGLVSMTHYSSVLIRSLIDRATALGKYLRSLQSSASRPDQGFAIALEMCARYADFFIRQVESDCSRPGTPEDLQRVLGGLAIDFFEKENCFRPAVLKNRTGGGTLVRRGSWRKGTPCSRPHRIRARGHCGSPRQLRDTQVGPEVLSLRQSQRRRRVA